jgi:hypothetical protein
MSFERELQRITQDVNFALPYWAWTDSTGNDNDEVLRWFGGDGDPTSLLPNYRCRQPTEDGWVCHCVIFNSFSVHFSAHFCCRLYFLHCRVFHIS